MSEILVGRAAADYLKRHPYMAQRVQETCKGIRITIDPHKNTTVNELRAVIAILDSLISERHITEKEEISDFTSNLYSSRSHLMRAIREVQK